MSSNLPTIRKAIATTLLALGTWLATAPTDGVTSAEWGSLAAAFIAGIVVFFVKNEPIEPV